MRLRTPQQRRLAAIDLFVGCTAAQITALDRLGTEVALAESTTLCREAVTPAQFVVVLSGRVQLRRGEQHVLTLTPGAWFGHVALLAGAPAEHVSAVAVVPTRVLVFSRREFFSMLAGAPTVAATLRAGESARYADLGAERPCATSSRHGKSRISARAALGLTSRRTGNRWPIPSM